MLALAALPASAEPQPIDRARQIRGEPATAGSPTTYTVHAQGGAVEPDEIGNVVTREPDRSISLDASAQAIPSIREILITLLEAGALVVLVVFLVLQSWRGTLIPLLLVSARRLVRRRRTANRVGQLGE